jgi:hypothetical protein
MLYVWLLFLEGQVIILGVDPGTVKSAFVQWDTAEKKIISKGIEDNPIILGHIYDEHYDVLVMEMIQSMGMPVGKEVFETVRWIGRFEEAAHCIGVTAQMVYRKDIKLYFCGSSRAKDGNIRQALLDLVGPQGKKIAPGPTYGVKGDEWSALAVTVFCNHLMDKTVAE